MYRLLNALERDALEAFFALEHAESFVLTGGAALAEFYFQHRLSHDLDLFTLSDEAYQAAVAQTTQLANMVGAEIEVIRTLTTLHQFRLRRGDMALKVDIVRDSGPSFGQPMLRHTARVDALENIGANKINALFGRAAARDYIDLFVILHDSPLAFADLLAKAKQKDLGLQEFYLAHWIHQQTPRLQSVPELLKPIALDAVQAYFLRLADELMASLKPEQ